jgi:hypothetical protein
MLIETEAEPPVLRTVFALIRFCKKPSKELALSCSALVDITMPTVRATG